MQWQPIHTPARSISECEVVTAHKEAGKARAGAAQGAGWAAAAEAVGALAAMGATAVLGAVQGPAREAMAAVLGGVPGQQAVVGLESVRRLPSLAVARVPLAMVVAGGAMVAVPMHQVRMVADQVARG
jgi:hypothetical protein